MTVQQTLRSFSVQSFMVWFF